MVTDAVAQKTAPYSHNIVTEFSCRRFRDRSVKTERFGCEGGIISDADEQDTSISIE